MKFLKIKQKDKLSESVSFDDITDTDDILTSDVELVVSKKVPKYKKYFLHPLKLFIIMIGHIIHILIVRH
jgi:hypothetical protein